MLPQRRPKVLNGFTYGASLKDEGKLWVTVNDFEGHPYEVFISIEKEDFNLSAIGEGLGRTLSIALRGGVPCEKLIDQLKGIMDENPCYYNGRVTFSIPDTIARILEDHLKGNHNGTPSPVDSSDHSNKDE